MIPKQHLDSNYLKNLKNITFKPIFILGMPRSGTTILYKMLGETDHFNVITVYHLIKYKEILHNHINNLEKNVKDELNTFFKKSGLKDREVDNIEVSADLVHEYAHIFPDRKYPFMGSLKSYKNQSFFEELCKKIMYISDNDKPILLKNPFDYDNFLKIKKIYPNAKFIFINRHPCNTISSQIRMDKQLYTKKNLYPAMFDIKYNDIFKKYFKFRLFRYYRTSRIISPFKLMFSSITYWQNVTDYYLENIKYLPEQDYISIRYEDLCNNPNNEISKILNFIKLETNKNFNNYIQQRDLKLLPEVKFLKKFIFKKMRFYYNYNSYSIWLQLSKIIFCKKNYMVNSSYKESDSPISS